MMIDSLIQSMLLQMKSLKLINEDDEDVYRFGLECFLLKVVHYLSYLFIGLTIRMTFPMIMSAVVIMPLRTKTGGYHAKTRLGCYFFSCFIVLLICLLNKLVFPVWLFLSILFGSNLIVWNYTPVENFNRGLDKLEIEDFRKKALVLLSVVDMVIIVTAITGYAVSQWLLNGLLMEAVLVVVGNCRKCYE